MNSQQSDAGARPASPARMLRSSLAPVVVLALLSGGCADIRPHVPQSEGHIMAPAKPKPAAEAPIPAPARTSTFVPPPRPAAKPQVYSVVVNEVPVKELLLALARDTKQNIDIHPGLQGLVSLNAINETLPAILERISKQVNLRHRVEGNTIIVSPDTPYMKTYRIAYVNMTRDTTSTIGVSGEIASGGSSGGSSGGGSGGGGSGGASAATSGSNTVVRTVLKNDFWDQMRDNIRSILSSTRNQSLTSEQRAERAESQRNAREERLQQAEAVARAGAAATTLFNTAFGAGAQQSTALGDIKDDVVVNPVSGTISVLGTDRQHQLVQQHIDSITRSVQKQVLIEATIVEVSLREGYQGGIDWSRIVAAGATGLSFTQSLLGGFAAAATAAGAATGNSVTIGYFNPNDSGTRNISATVRLLQEFGNTRVLSSPKLMALNNQTALLKVVDNIVYFEIQAQTNTTQGVATTTFNSAPKMVSVGVVMGVTPQISDDGRVSLTVRPTISRVLRFRDDPNPSLVVGGQRISNPVPEIQVREMESVLQIATGQTVILGGLMQDDTRRDRDQLPGADRAGEAGEAMRFRNELAQKTELVIFLRPTIVTNPGIENDELRFFQRFLPQAEASPAEQPATKPTAKP